MFRKVRNFKALLFFISISMLLSLHGYSQNHYSQNLASLTNWTRQANASVVSVDLKNANTVKQYTPILKGKDHGIAIEPAENSLDDLTAAPPGDPIISVKGNSLPIYLFDMLTTSLKSAFTNFSFISTAHANQVCCNCSDGCMEVTTMEDCVLLGCTPCTGICIDGECDGDCDDDVVIAPIPTLGQLGLIAMAGLLGLFALFIIIRRLRHKVG